MVRIILKKPTGINYDPVGIFFQLSLLRTHTGQYSFPSGFSQVRKGQKILTKIGKKM